MSFLQVSEIRKNIQGMSLLEGVSFEQVPFQNIGIIGETGSGKSTLMKIIGGYGQADSGKVFFKGERVRGSEEQLLPGHKGIAYLSQYFELRNHYRMEELLEYANTMDETAANELYRICRIDHLLKRKTDQLSGGEKQRIALARLLVGAPELLLLDEPYSNLDLMHKNMLKEVIRDLSEQMGITCMLVSHDPQDILSWAHRVLVLRDGHIVQEGTPEEVYNHPKDAYVAGLLGNFNILSADVVRELFARVPKIRLTDRDVFIRPEGFKVMRYEPHLVGGEISSISFQGGYYDVEVIVAGQKLQARTDEPGFRKGDPISLAVAPEAIVPL